MFALEKLKVYDKALTSAASLAQCSGLWDKRHKMLVGLRQAWASNRADRREPMADRDEVCEKVCD
jgi:hypothetical protein